MTDLELLALAARSIGEEFHSGHRTVNGKQFEWVEWNPLADDGDAMRLAVRREIEVRNFNGKAHAGKQGRFWCTENWFPDGDRFAANRRAIVRAAAEIAKQQPSAEGEKVEPVVSVPLELLSEVRDTLGYFHVDADLYRRIGDLIAAAPQPQEQK